MKRTNTHNTITPNSLYIKTNTGMFFSGANWVVVVLLVFHLLSFYFTLQIHLIWFVFACHFLIWLLHILSVYYKACEYISHSHSYLHFFCLFRYISFVLLASPFFAIFVRLSVWDSDSELKTEKGFSTSLSKCTFVILVRVECTPSDMLVSLSLANDFRGRIYATGTVYILGQ